MHYLETHTAYSPYQVKKEAGEFYMGLSLPLPRSDTHHFLLHITAHISQVDLPNYKGYSEVGGAKGILVSFTVSAVFFRDRGNVIISEYLVRLLGTNSSLHRLPHLVERSLGIHRLR